MIINYKHPEKAEHIILPESLVECMIRHCTEHFPKEFGGIMTGLAIGKTKFIFDIEVPVSFENSATGFTRHADELNKYLTNCFDKTDGHIVYLGEWHSHPNGSSSYSANDARSMAEIGKNDACRQAFPLLIILGISRNIHEIAVYEYDGTRLIQFKKI